MILHQPCLLASAGIGAVLAGCSTAWATPALTTLATFNPSNGAYPHAGLLADAAGNLYGTTETYGPSGDGTVFEIDAQTHAISILAAFNGINGALPEAPLISDAAGNLYGTTYSAGVGGHGTVFEVAAGTRALSTLASFGGSRGANPYAGLTIDAAGNLYGTTSDGAAGYGTVFEIAAGTRAFSTLVTFSGTNGAYPYAGMIADAAGNLYGTTLGGGAYGHGSVFELAAGTHALSTLASFNGSNGASPWFGRLIADASGNLYGTTEQGGSSVYGTVFELAAGTNSLSTLVSFNNTNGGNPYGGLIADAAGNLYGTTSGGGPGHASTVFEIAVGTHTLSTLVAFDNTHGAVPYGDLIADAAGNLYGTTYLGGGYNMGVAFELSNTGFVTSAPEPAAASLIGLAGLGLLARRRFSRRADLS